MTSDNRILAEYEGEMAGEAGKVFDRAKAIHEQIIEGRDTGRASWAFVPDDEPPAADTLEAVESFRAFMPVRWWTTPDVSL